MKNTAQRAVILDAAMQDRLDLTSAEVLKKFVLQMQREGIANLLAELRTPVVQFARRIGSAGIIEKGRSFPTIDAAVRSLES